MREVFNECNSMKFGRINLKLFRFILSYKPMISKVEINILLL